MAVAQTVARAAAASRCRGNVWDTSVSKWLSSQGSTSEDGRFGGHYNCPLAGVPASRSSVCCLFLGARVAEVGVSQGNSASEFVQCINNCNEEESKCQATPSDP